MAARIRRARPDEADRVAALARRSRGSWVDPQDWMDAWQSELIITSEYVTAQHVFVAEELGCLSGMAALEIAGVTAALEQDAVGGRSLGLS